MRIAWEERGSGHPLLLIQGLGYARWSWEPIVAPLADRYRVLFFDNRGIGESDKPAGASSASQRSGSSMATTSSYLLRSHSVGRGRAIAARMPG